MAVGPSKTHPGLAIIIGKMKGGHGDDGGDPRVEAMKGFIDAVKGDDPQAALRFYDELCEDEEKPEGDEPKDDAEDDGY